MTDITTTAIGVSPVPTLPAQRKVYPPVGLLGLWFSGWIAIWLRIFSGAEARRIFVRRCELTRQRIADKKEFARVKKALAKEALDFAKLIELAYTQLGQRSDRRWDGRQTAEKGKRSRIAKIQFHKIFIDSEVIWFKVLTRKRGLLGTRAMLPFGIRVENLVDETAHKQLQATLERDVLATASANGVWIRIFRLQGTDGIPKLVTFREILEKYANPVEMLQGKIMLGVGDRKVAHHFYLDDNPHVLVGGATLTGKSNLINTVISALIRFLTPAQLQLTLIDLKLVEFTFYEDTPHLARPIVFSLKDVLETLIEIRKELFRRAELFKAHKVKNLYSWNARFPTDQLPRHVVIIDEFAELINGDDKELSEQIFKQARSISSLGRALGIHLIICTQRPSAQVVPMDIKNNMAVRIGGPTGDMHASRIIMDTGDLATLEDIKGRMIYKLGAYRHKIQTPRITEDDIEECVAIAKGRAAGIIDLSGVEVVVNRDGMSRWILANNAGALAFTPLYQALKPLAVTRDMLQAYLKDIAGQLELADGTKLEIVATGNTRKLINPSTELSDESKAFIAKIDAELDRLLPMPAMPPTAQIPPDLPPPDVQLEPESFDQYDQFIREGCISESGATVLASDLYAGYKTWCSQRGYIPETETKFGKEIAQKTVRKRTERGRVYVGLTLHPTIQNVGSVGSENDTLTNENTEDVGLVMEVAIP
jgi:hypothetical protein